MILKMLFLTFLYKMTGTDKNKLFEINYSVVFFLLFALIIPYILDPIVHRNNERSFFKKSVKRDKNPNKTKKNVPGCYVISKLVYGSEEKS